MKLKTSKSKNTTLFYIIKDYTKNGKRSTKIIKSIGNLEDIKVIKIIKNGLKIMWISIMKNTVKAKQWLLKRIIEKSFL